jgi:hypothetical protein
MLRGLGAITPGDQQMVLMVEGGVASAKQWDGKEGDVPREFSKDLRRENGVSKRTSSQKRRGNRVELPRLS